MWGNTPQGQMVPFSRLYRGGYEFLPQQVLLRNKLAKWEAGPVGTSRAFSPWPKRGATGLLSTRKENRQTLGVQRWRLRICWPPKTPETQKIKSDSKVTFGSSHKYPLTRNYYENNSLRIIFRNFEAILYPQNLRERRTFSRNYAWDS